MLLDLGAIVLKHDWKVKGVIHAGAHLAEEANEYDRLFGRHTPVTWIEANPDVHAHIERALEPYPSQRLVGGCLWSLPGVPKTFHVTNYQGMSSSLLEFGTHPEFSPDTVFTHDLELTTTTLDEIDSIIGLDGNFLNMDLQGVELEVLRGGEKLLDQIDYINTEVNTAEVYVGCAQLSELDAYLGSVGFTRVETYIVPGQGWGDAAYTRRPR